MSPVGVSTSSSVVLSIGLSETDVSGGEVTSAVPHDEQKLTPFGLR